jgi:predicted KAP-like P-loop ATPase
MSVSRWEIARVFRPDLPIKSSSEDQLSRASFGRALADALLAYAHKESVVAALYGDWGSGKSSVLNLVLEHIETRAKDLPEGERPIVVRFNPWNYSDQNQLVGQFFRSLSVALRRRDSGETAQKVGEQLDAYAAFFAPLTLIPDPTGLGNVLAVAANAVLKKVGVALVAWGKLKNKDLEKVRADLDVLLAAQRRKILVVIDDIDRLNSTEIRQIFQLVKSLGDFPNTLYLLAFAREVVVTALAEVQKGSGEEYLEKIVQIPFRLPTVSVEEVHKLLFTQLEQLIEQVPQDRWDQNHWGNVFRGGLREFFRSIRDVNRYVNALRFVYPMVADEVNGVDFLAITALQVFEPQVYDGVRDNPDLFAGLFRDGYGDRRAEKAQAKERIDEIVARAVTLNPEQMQELLQHLFPKLDSIYERIEYGSDRSAEWRAAGRVSNDEKFPTYFRLAIPVGEIPEREMRSIVSTAVTQQAFAEAVLSQIESGRAERFIERLQDFTRDRIPIEHVPNVVTTLMDVGDLLPEGSGRGFLIERDTSMQIMRVFYQLSQRYETQQARFDLFRDAIANSELSIYTIVREVGLQGQQHGKGSTRGDAEPEDRRTVSSAHLEELERLAVEKIEAWAVRGRLDKHRNLASILFTWKRLAADGDWCPRTFVSGLIATDDGLVDFVTAFESRSYVYGSTDGEQVRYNMDLSSIEQFAEVGAIEPRLRAIASGESLEALPEQGRRAVQTFLDTFDGKLKDRW